MLTTLIIAAALCGQAVPRNEIADGMGRQTQAQRIAAKRAALSRQARAREYRQLEAEADKDRAFEAALPAMAAAEREAFYRMTAAEQTMAMQRMAAANERTAAVLQLDMIQRRNARLGYGTPALDMNTPAGMMYGNSGAIMYGAPQGLPYQPQNNGNGMPMPYNPFFGR